MRALVVGPTGVNFRDKDDNVGAIPRLRSCAYIEKNKEDSKVVDDKQDLNSRRYLKCYYFEDFMKFDFRAYLDSDDYGWQRDRWVETFIAVLKQIARDKPANALLCMNMPYMRDGRFFPAPSLSLIRKFKPDVIVVLTEDIHAAWKRINILRELQGKTRTKLRISELFAWRSATIMLADILANDLYRKQISRYVIGVKHPPRTLQRLLLKPRILRIYASFPITDTRSNPELRSKIDELRMALHDKFTVFDPACVDDRPIINKLKDSGPEKVVLAKEDRWPLPADFPMCQDEDELYPIEIPREEVAEVEEAVDNQITYRDYLLEDSADVVVALRPNISGRTSPGVDSEIKHANTTGKPVYLFWPKEDGTRAQKPLGWKTVPFDDFDALITELQRYEKEKLPKYRTAI